MRELALWATLLGAIFIVVAKGQQLSQSKGTTMSTMATLDLLGNLLLAGGIALATYKKVI